MKPSWGQWFIIQNTNNPNVSLLTGKKTLSLSLEVYFGNQKIYATLFSRTLCFTIFIIFGCSHGTYLSSDVSKRKTIRVKNKTTVIINK